MPPGAVHSRPAPLPYLPYPPHWSPGHGRSSAVLPLPDPPPQYQNPYKTDRSQKDTALPLWPPSQNSDSLHIHLLYSNCVPHHRNPSRKDSLLYGRQWYLPACRKDLPFLSAHLPLHCRLPCRPAIHKGQPGDDTPLPTAYPSRNPHSAPQPPWKKQLLPPAASLSLLLSGNSFPRWPWRPCPRRHCGR